MDIRIDSECLKFRDSRILRVRSGKMSIEAFALTIKPDDPFMLIGNTIYAMTESEFYAMRLSTIGGFIGEKAFHYVLDNVDTSIFMQQDADFIRRVKLDLPTCPACRYKRYKDAVHNLIKRYKVVIPKEYLDGHAEAMPEYPGVDSEIVSKIPFLTEFKTNLKVPVRKGCIDCVEKHVSQAYVISRECQIGYPEYVYMVAGHLSEALDELPVGLDVLRKTLEFCLAKTNYDGKAFVPLALLAPCITDARRKMSMLYIETEDPDKMTTSADVDMSLELTDEMRAELAGIDDKTAAAVRQYCEQTLNFTTKLENSTDAQLGWEGTMAMLADLLAYSAPKTANMVRDRRLVFTTNPALSRDAGLDMSDVLEAASRVHP